MERQTMKYLPKILLALLLSAIPALPWGSVGHKTVAYLALINLSTATLEKIRPLLAGESLEDISIWADTYKRSHRNTSPWHYIDLPVRQAVTVSNISRYYASSGHRPSDNVISQIKIDIKELKDPGASFKEKQLALKYLVHFMGDVHMPLHVGEDNDAGGNGKRVRFFAPTSSSNKGHITSLHSLWDNLIEVKAAEDPEQLGNELNAKITVTEKQKWDLGSVEDWAVESYTISRDVIYPGLKAGPVEAVVVLPRDYYSRMRPIVDEQIEKAGVRLARVLEEIFGK
jgi:hypothetical protein